jgi:pyrroloquinoline quinone biosynthesis protein B
MRLFVAGIVLVLISCGPGKEQPGESKKIVKSDSPVRAKNPGETYLVVLGTVQDGGSPHIGCTKPCCKNLFEHPDPLRKVVSLGVVDSKQNKSWLFEATPDITTQVKSLKKYSQTEMPDAIFVTHAHIGHYTGLMYLGKEAKNTKKQLVYAMPRMKSFLETNGPWSQLVRDSNIVLNRIEAEGGVATGNLSFSVVPILVPHRDEFSETVGYIITGVHKSVLFIPDIDKWNKWDKDIKEMIGKVDYALIDGTFYNENELPGRDISKIPHPFVVESMELFKDLPAKEKKKIYFIHLNHTNPLLDENSTETKHVLEKGFNIARMNMMLEL